MLEVKTLQGCRDTQQIRLEQLGILKKLLDMRVDMKLPCDKLS